MRRKRFCPPTDSLKHRPFPLSFVLISVLFSLVASLSVISRAATSASPIDCFPLSSDRDAPPPINSVRAFPAETPSSQRSPGGEKIDWSSLLPLIRQYIEANLKEFGVPGLAVAIVDQDKTIMAEGFGWRQVEKKLPVTARSRFVLGSTTKAFTTFALGLLVEEGKMSWDEPVRRYLPEFALRDDWATLRCTPRDLVTHRTGLPRHDLVWSGASLSPEEIVGVLRFLEPSRDFRAVFQYNNLMYITAGVLVSRVAGLPWEEFIEKRIFAPLNMKNSGCTLDEYLASPEYSYSYTKAGDKLEAIPFPSPQQKIMYGPRASGSVNSTDEDMAQWVRLHLNEGEVSGQRLMAAERIREMHTPQIVRPANPGEAPEIEHPSYGLGWMIDSYRSHYRVHHGGSTMGFSSFVVFFPQEKFGAAILSNLSSPLPTLIGNYISDLALGLPPLDWKAKLASRPAATPSVKPTPAKAVKLIRPLADYTGEFIHPAYGQLRTESDGEKIFLVFRQERIELEPSGWDVFRPKEASWRRFPLHFLANNRGEMEAVAIPLEPAVKDIIFERLSGKN